MPARVKVRAVIWIADKLVVHHSSRLGKQRMTLPGGWVGNRESVTDALIREVDEELSIKVEIEDLLCAGEVINSTSRQDVELIFAVKTSDDLDPGRLTLIDPLGPEAEKVLPPILPQLAEQRRARSLGEHTPLWLWNVYLPDRTHT